MSLDLKSENANSFATITVAVNLRTLKVYSHALSFEKYLKFSNEDILQIIISGRCIPLPSLFRINQSAKIAYWHDQINIMGSN